MVVAKISHNYTQLICECLDNQPIKVTIFYPVFG